jgi:hypothetical protein
MRLSASDRNALARSIDDRWAPDRSIVLRYAGAVRFRDDGREDAEVREGLERNSLGEGARVVPLLEYRGVELSVLDETSRMATGTMKAVDGCVTSSLLQASGARRAAFESGGNTGSALTAYGRRAGIETYFFCPSENLDLLDSRLFQAPTSHLVGVHDRRTVKGLTALFAEETGIPRVPPGEWRLGASLFRGLFVLEHLLESRACDWLVQSVSAGFGPIGIYRVLRAFEGAVGPPPRFLGVQQAANAPVYRALARGAGDVPGAHEDRRAGLLSRVMYDPAPQTYGTMEDLREVVLSTSGNVVTVDDGEFEEHTVGAAIPSLLEEQGIRISRRHGAVLDKTGLMALVGAMKAIEAGGIAAGSRVLCCLTSGMSDSDGRAEPEAVVAGEQDVLRYIERTVGRPGGG